MILKQYKIKKYDTSFYDIWNQFVAESKNGTFLFHRDFMEYHADRFEDCSLLVLDEKDKLVAILPANRVGNELFSHQGLTYGGIYFLTNLSISEIKEVFDSILLFLKELKFSNLVLKNQPALYSERSSYGLDYILFKYFQPELIKREMNFMIDYHKPLMISKSKLKHFKRISKLELRIVEEADLTSFWNKVLIPCLESKHSVKPVHSLQEIQKLRDTFPHNIVQFSVYLEKEILAGITLFITKKGVKSQYGASTKLGQSYRALDYLFITLIEKFKKGKFDFFDMGTATEDNELGYNPGLVTQKQELGCLIYNQDRILIKI